MLENKFQALLIDELEKLFPGCLVMKLDANYMPGIPDLLVLFEDAWAVLECKKSAKARPRPNQPYYVDMLNEMSFAAFIYPENKDEILDELQRSFESRRAARVSQR